MVEKKTETTSHHRLPHLKSFLMLPLYLLVSLTFWAPPAFPDSGAGPVFTLALESFKQNDLAKSRETFLQLIQDSPDDPVLLYNLGLVELTDQHPGRALAYWRKALYLRPGFSPALEGLRRIEGQKGTGVPALTLWQKFPRLISLPALLAITLASLSLCLFFGIRWRRAQKFQLATVSITSVIGFGLLTLVMSLLSWFHFSQTQQFTLATVMLPAAAVHSSPSENSPALFDFREGDEVRVRRTDGEWLQVQKGATAIGWIKKEQIFVHSGQI